MFTTRPRLLLLMSVSGDHRRPVLLNDENQGRGMMLVGV